MVKKRVKNVARKSLRERKSVPALVKVIAILFYISAFASLILGIVLLVGGIAGSSAIKKTIQLQLGNEEQANLWFIKLILSSPVTGGIVILLLGVLDFFIGRGLWKGKKWARIFVIVIMALSFVSSLIALDVIGAVLSGLIGGYLWFSRGVRSAFR